MDKPSKILLVIAITAVLLTGVCLCTRLLPKPEPVVTTVDQPLSPEKININTATAQELTQLPGIGKILADRIVAYREQNGNFEKIGDLLFVSGIGQGKLEAVADLITVGG